jgi:hypothetical protein
LGIHLQEGGMSETKTIKVQGIGTLGALGILFVCLKLTGHIGWSWWWVTAPFWAPTCLVLGILAGFLALAGVGLLVAHGVDAVAAIRRRRAWPRRAK